MKKFFLILLSILLLAGCTSTPTELVYRKISAQEAKAMLDESTDLILLDVRTEAEFAAGHIEGAILIPDSELATRAETELPDKDALILIYCRSGNRSAKAARQLLEMGYSQVYDFGGILDWPYDLVP